LTVGEGRETRHCSEVERIVSAVLSIFLYGEDRKGMTDLQQLQQYYEQTLCDKIGQAQRAQTDWLGFCKDAQAQSDMNSG